MRTRHRPDEERPPGQGPSPPGAGGDLSLDGLRRAGDDFLAAGDAAIERVLSANSQAFLAQSRQQGGE